jgi:excinuclease ABC subunit C
LGNNNQKLYVGKSKNLKSRLHSYFLSNLLPKTRSMMNEASYLSYIKVTTELEALLLEAKLIKKYKPFYNSALKDDKNPLYIKIVKEEYPRILTVRKNELDNSIAIYGPFPNTNAVFSVLKMLRKIFPFSQHKLSKYVCIYKQMGLCDPCPNEINQINDIKKRILLKIHYLKNIRSIKQILDGKFYKVKDNLNHEMDIYSKKSDYESAIKIRDQIKKLEYITQPISNIDTFLENPNFAEDVFLKEQKDLKDMLSRYFKIRSFSRIECYDVSHLAGTNPTASMVTFINGVPDKNFYRRFKLNQNSGMDDLASLRETAKRRFKYLKIWGKPDLIMVDGGKNQVSVFIDIFKNTNIPIVGLAKIEEKLVIPFKSKYIELKLRGYPLFLIQRIRDEAHRFARKYHQKLFKKALLN